MPILRFSKALGIARDVKVFLNLESGVVRKADPPTFERYEELMSLVREQKKALRSKDREIKKQARTLSAQQQQIHQRRGEVRRQRLEIQQLRNELGAMNEPVGSARDASSASQASGKPETGALPDFVIIGAQKGGTGRFYSLLTGHPNVEGAAVKEVRYFTKPEGSYDVEWYRRCFPPPKWKDGQRSITGEATPSYLFRPQVPKRMAEVIPKARLIVLLRNPIDRAYSHYNMQVRNGKEVRSFEEAVEEEQARLLDDTNGSPDPGTDSLRLSEFLARGIYVDQLLRWREFFDEEQMLVLKSEDFFQRELETLEQAQDFLGLPYREPDSRPHGTGRRYEPMNPATRRRLEAFFEPHNRRLYEYLGVDLGW